MPLPELVPWTEDHLSSYRPGGIFADDGTAIDRILAITIEDEWCRLFPIKKSYTEREPSAAPHWKDWLSRVEAKNHI